MGNQESGEAVRYLTVDEIRRYVKEFHEAVQKCNVAGVMATEETGTLMEALLSPAQYMHLATSVSRRCTHTSAATARAALGDASGPTGTRTRSFRNSRRNSRRGVDLDIEPHMASPSGGTRKTLPDVVLCQEDTADNDNDDDRLSLSVSRLQAVARSEASITSASAPVPQPAVPAIPLISSRDLMTEDFATKAASEVVEAPRPGAVEFLLLGLERSISSDDPSWNTPEVAAEGFTALALLLRPHGQHPEGTSAAVQRRIIAHVGGPEIVVNAMRTHCPYSRVVAEQACRLLRNISFDHPGLQQALGEIGVCRVIADQIATAHLTELGAPGLATATKHPTSTLPAAATTADAGGGTAAATGGAAATKEAGTTSPTRAPAPDRTAQEDEQLLRYVLSAINNLSNHTENRNRMKESFFVSFTRRILPAVGLVHSCDLALLCCMVMGCVLEDHDGNKETMLRVGGYRAFVHNVRPLLDANPGLAVSFCKQIPKMIGDNFAAADSLGEAGCCSAVAEDCLEQCRSADWEQKTQPEAASGVAESSSSNNNQTRSGSGRRSRSRSPKRSSGRISPTRWRSFSSRRNAGFAEDDGSSADGAEPLQSGESAREANTQARAPWLAVVACQAMHALGLSERNLSRMADCRAMSQIATALRVHGSGDALLAEWACRVIAILGTDTAAARRAREHDHSQIIGDAQAAESLLVHAMAAHANTNTTVAEWSCRAMSNLAAKCGENRTRIGDLGGCEQVVECVLKPHATNWACVAKACRAISNLVARQHRANQDRFCALGTIGLVTTSALARGAAASTSADMDVETLKQAKDTVNQGCRALCNLCSHHPGNQAQCCGSADTLVAVLRTYGSFDATIAGSAARAVRRALMSSGSSSSSNNSASASAHDESTANNRRRLVDAGACEALIQSVLTPAISRPTSPASFEAVLLTIQDMLELGNFVASRFVICGADAIFQSIAEQHEALPEGARVAELANELRETIRTLTSAS